MAVAKGQTRMIFTSRIDERFRDPLAGAVPPPTHSIMNQPPDSISSTLVVGPLVIDLERRAVAVEGVPVVLSATEFGILVLLARQAGMAFTRQQILEGLHGARHAISERAVDVQIVGLRTKLGTHARHLETVRGIGYRLRDINACPE
jgi:two-component system, OmpR family, alkaline phosphatase synthesis response regulator PhoP